jgi:hypothetical protein
VSCAHSGAGGCLFAYDAPGSVPSPLSVVWRAPIGRSGVAQFSIVALADVKEWYFLVPAGQGGVNVCYSEADHGADTQTWLQGSHGLMLTVLVVGLCVQIVRACGDKRMYDFSTGPMQHTLIKSLFGLTLTLDEAFLFGLYLIGQAITIAANFRAPSLQGRHSQLAVVLGNLSMYELCAARTLRHLL